MRRVAARQPVAKARSRLLRAALLASLALAFVWTAGFGWFLRAATRPPATPEHADGIVALTGGAERVETGLRLLAGGLGDRLLVSGVNPAAGFSELSRRAGVGAGLAGRVELGKAASDTHGNAVETAAWARQNNIRSLIVVTAGYHMPRALAELSRAMPDVAMYPYPVLSTILRGPHESLRADAAELRLLATEYTKWIAAEAGISKFSPRPPVTPAAERARLAPLSKTLGSKTPNAKTEEAPPPAAGSPASQVPDVGGPDSDGPDSEDRERSSMKTQAPG